MNKAETVLVLGAGIQGACAALVAARRGYHVRVVDRALQCMERASLRNEGKIHLGHVYANDPSFRTADLMLRAALSFAPLLDRWIPDQFCWPALRSNSFSYIIVRDSLVPMERLLGHYARVEDQCLALQSMDPTLHYLGRSLTRLWQTQEIPPFVNREVASGAVATPEVSVDLVGLRQVIAAALERDPRIVPMYGHAVDEVVRRSHGFTVAGVTTTGQRWHLDAGHVVNALWDGRLAIDAQLGLVPNRPWVYRFKHRVLGRLPLSLAGLPSMTFVLGAFGDVVTRPNDDLLYLSWYPTCMTGWSQTLEPPAAWRPAAMGALRASEQQPIIRDTLTAFDRLIPGLAETTSVTADGGVIFSWGDSDIDHADSELHQRYQIGVFSADGYYSINTGKLTSAPYFAQQLGDMLP